MAFCFKNANKDIIMTKEVEQDFGNDFFCRFCDKEYFSEKVRDHCHLAGFYTSPAHSICNINVTQKQSSFILFNLHNSSNFDCQFFFGKIVDKKMTKYNLILNLKQTKNNFQ